MLTIIVPTLAACDSLGQLRRRLRGEQTATALRIEVTPQDASISLDGQPVAQRSPYVPETIAAGEHLLLVEAAGFHPFRLAFTLPEGTALTIPIALRVAPPPEPQRPGMPPPSPPAPALPTGVSPVRMVVAATPSVPVLLDDYPSTGKELLLERVTGTIAIGPMRLPYRLGGAGLLELTIPEDGASWTRDGNPALPGNSFRLHPGVVRLVRIAPMGTEQVAVLRRAP